LCSILVKIIQGYGARVGILPGAGAQKSEGAGDQFKI